MEKTNTFRSIFTILLLTALSFIISCEHSTTPINNTHNDYGKTGNISGKVLRNLKEPLYDVEVSVGTLKTKTNSNGDFFLENVPTGVKVLVNFKLDGFTSTQKITEVRNSKTSQLEATLMPLENYLLDATSGGIIDIKGAKVTIPASSLVDAKGNNYSGTAQVRAKYFDPTSETFYGSFPGEFKGIRTDKSETPIESFGFINVEILNGTEKLRLATGKQASINFPIPSSLLGKAPATIPLWYYDEINGLWLEEGTATKTGNNYIGNVSHFSSWNCDIPGPTSFLEGKVVDDSGKPISYARVFTIGGDYNGRSTVFTNDDGTFKIPVKASSITKIWASFYYNESTKLTITTIATGLSLNIGTITIHIENTEFCKIIGRAVDIGNHPLPEARVLLLDSKGKWVDETDVNQNGQFLLLGKQGTNYQVLVYLPTVESEDSINNRLIIVTPIKDDKLELGDIKLDFGGFTIIGRVVDKILKPKKDVRVYFHFKNIMRSCYTGTTDSTGKYSIYVNPDKDVNISFLVATDSTGKNIESFSTKVTSGKFGDTLNIGDFVIPL